MNIRCRKFIENNNARMNELYTGEVSSGVLGKMLQWKLEGNVRIRCPRPPAWTRQTLVENFTFMYMEVENLTFTYVD